MKREQTDGIVIWKETEDEAATRLEHDREREERARVIREAFQRGYEESRR